MPRRIQRPWASEPSQRPRPQAQAWPNRSAKLCLGRLELRHRFAHLRHAVAGEARRHGAARELHGRQQQAVRALARTRHVGARSVCSSSANVPAISRQHFRRRRGDGRAQERLNLLEPREDRADGLAILRRVAGPPAPRPHAGAGRGTGAAARAADARGRGRRGARPAARIAGRAIGPARSPTAAGLGTGAAGAARRNRAARAIRRRTRACPAAARWPPRSPPRSRTPRAPARRAGRRPR